MVRRIPAIACCFAPINKSGASSLQPSLSHLALPPPSSVILRTRLGGSAVLAAMSASSSSSLSPADSALLSRIVSLVQSQGGSAVLSVLGSQLCAAHGAGVKFPDLNQKKLGLKDFLELSGRFRMPVGNGSVQLLNKKGLAAAATKPASSSSLASNGQPPDVRPKLPPLGHVLGPAKSGASAASSSKPATQPPCRVRVPKPAPAAANGQTPKPTARSAADAASFGSATMVQTTDALGHLPTYVQQLDAAAIASDDGDVNQHDAREDARNSEQSRQRLEKDEAAPGPINPEDDGSVASFDRDDSTASAAPPVDDELTRLFFPDRDVPRRLEQHGYVLGDVESSKLFREAALMGRLQQEPSAPGDGSVSGAAVDAASSDSLSVYLNTHEPFCLATVGVQGSGKSHTMGVVLESCLLPCPHPRGRELIRLRRPMTALVLHYDQNVSSLCEATGLLSLAPALERLFGFRCAMPRDRVVVLVSPSYYEQRRRFYGDHCTVRPLLFRWRTLSADQIKKLMRIKETDSQLYVSSMLALLRKYQRAARVPDFEGFMAEVRATCTVASQAAPLLQRIALLESLVYESAMSEPLRSAAADVSSSLQSGMLIVADLTDPLLSSDEANGIFQVLTEQFRSTPCADGGGKLLALDEAHRFMQGDAADGLSNAIVESARLMRHDGMRVVVSTQSPKVLAPELLELVSVAVMHRFHSRDWFSYLAQKLPLDEAAFHTLLQMPPGSALVFAARHRMQASDRHVMLVHIRPRLTADRGSSRTNVGRTTNNAGHGRQAPNSSEDSAQQHVQQASM